MKKIQTSLSAYGTLHPSYVKRGVGFSTKAELPNQRGFVLRFLQEILLQS